MYKSCMMLWRLWLCVQELYDAMEAMSVCVQELYEAMAVCTRAVML